MTTTLTITQADLGNFTAGIERTIAKHQNKIVGAMQDKLFECIMGNFGPTGFDRPWPWYPLSAKYAKRVGRSYATMFVSGALAGAVNKSGVENGTASVSLDLGLEYAGAHHYGRPDGNRKHPGTPARRVMPVDSNDEVTPATFLAVQEAARDALREALS